MIVADDCRRLPYCLLLRHRTCFFFSTGSLKWQLTHCFVRLMLCDAIDAVSSKLMPKMNLRYLVYLWLIPLSIHDEVILMWKKFRCHIKKINPYSVKKKKDLPWYCHLHHFSSKQ